MSEEHYIDDARAAAAGDDPMEGVQPTDDQPEHDSDQTVVDAWVHGRTSNVGFIPARGGWRPVRLLPRIAWPDARDDIELAGFEHAEELPAPDKRWPAYRWEIEDCQPVIFQDNHDGTAVQTRVVLEGADVETAAPFFETRLVPFDTVSAAPGDGEVPQSGPYQRLRNERPVSGTRHVANWLASLGPAPPNTISNHTSAAPTAPTASPSGMPASGGSNLRGTKRAASSDSDSEDEGARKRGRWCSSSG